MFEGACTESGYTGTVNIAQLPDFNSYWHEISVCRYSLHPPLGDLQLKSMQREKLGRKDAKKDEKNDQEKMIEPLVLSYATIMTKWILYLF